MPSKFRNFVFDRLIIPQLTFFFILLTYLFNIVLYCERKSVLVTRGSYRVLSYTQPIRLGQNQIVIQG